MRNAVVRMRVGSPTDPPALEDGRVGNGVFWHPFVAPCMFKTNQVLMSMATGLVFLENGCDHCTGDQFVRQDIQLKVLD